MPVDEPQAADEGAGAGLEIGPRLRAAREQRELTLENVASAMHVDVSVLRNLENEQFDVLGAAVYVRGHLRKYATLLGLPAEELVRAYQSRVAQVEVLPIISEGMAMSRRRRGKGALVAAVLVLLALLLAAAAWWWLGLRDQGDTGAGELDSAPRPASAPPPLPVVTERPQQQVQEARELPPPRSAGEQDRGQVETAQVDQPVPAAVSARDDEPDAGQDAAASAAPPTQDAPGEPPPAALPSEPLSSLELVFAEESWAEVYDSAGQRVLYGLFNAGTTRRLAAQGPFRVYLGYARGVTITVDGEPFEIPESVFRGNTARFDIDAGQ